MKTVSKFGGLVEVRSGQFTQELPVFVRMIDKDSGWTMNNGLPTLITTLLQVLIISHHVCCIFVNLILFFLTL